ncbi:MAG: cache domain-containing protein, partial [Blastocatellia bacterium]
MTKTREKAAVQEGRKLLRVNVLYLLGRLGLKTLRAKVFFAGLVFIVGTLVVVCGVAYWSFYSAIDTSPELRQSASRAAKTIDMLVFENVEFAKSIASDPYIVDKAEKAAQLAESLGVRSQPDAGQILDLETRYNKTRILQPDPALNEFLAEKSRVKGVFQRMFFTDRYGLNVGMTGMSEDFVQSDEAWWQEAMKRGVYIDDVGFDKPTGTWALEICVAIPHPRTGQPNGVLKVKYNLMDAEQAIAEFKQRESDYAYAVNQAGLYVLHKEPAKRDQPIEPELANAGLLKSASENDAGVINYRGLNPETKKVEDRIASFSKSQGFSLNGVRYQGLGWIFIVDNSRAEIFSPAYRMLGRMIIIGIVMLLLLSGFAYLFSSSLSGAVR